MCGGGDAWAASCLSFAARLPLVESAGTERPGTQRHRLLAETTLSALPCVVAVVASGWGSSGLLLRLHGEGGFCFEPDAARCSFFCERSPSTFAVAASGIVDGGVWLVAISESKLLST